MESGEVRRTEADPVHEIDTTKDQLQQDLVRRLSQVAGVIDRVRVRAGQVDHELADLSAAIRAQVRDARQLKLNLEGGAR